MNTSASRPDKSGFLSGNAQDLCLGVDCSYVSNNIECTETGSWFSLLLASKRRGPAHFTSKSFRIHHVLLNELPCTALNTYSSFGTLHLPLLTFTGGVYSHISLIPQYSFANFRY
jgi:hypothetical protein